MYIEGFNMKNPHFSQGVRVVVVGAVLAAAAPLFGCNSPTERAVGGAALGGIGGAGIGALASGGNTTATLGGAALGAAAGGLAGAATAPAQPAPYYR